MKIFNDSRLNKPLVIEKIYNLRNYISINSYNIGSIISDSAVLSFEELMSVIKTFEKDENKVYSNNYLKSIYVTKFSKNSTALKLKLNSAIIEIFVTGTLDLKLCAEIINLIIEERHRNYELIESICLYLSGFCSGLIEIDKYLLSTKSEKYEEIRKDLVKIVSPQLSERVFSIKFIKRLTRDKIRIYKQCVQKNNFKKIEIELVKDYVIKKEIESLFGKIWNQIHFPNGVTDESNKSA